MPWVPMTTGRVVNDMRIMLGGVEVVLSFQFVRCMGFSHVSGRSYWFSGFWFIRVKRVDLGSSGFIVQCMVCRGRVFGLNRRPFWFESDREGAFSGLLSMDDFVFRCGLYDPPSPLSVEGLFSVSFSGEESYFRLTGSFFHTPI
jgi:hypothetical protein